MANEVVTAEKKYDLQIMGSAMSDSIAEEMEGLGQIQFDRVKIPSGGITVFEIPGDDPDNPETASELKGVILYHHPMNARWDAAYNGENQPPTCSSIDGKTGSNGQACKTCPYNKFGSASDGVGKACKNMHRIYILPEGSPIPVILTLPPTGIRAFADYVGKRILVAGKRSYEVITKITLKKAKSSGGITYSSPVFQKVGIIDAEEDLKKLKAMHDTVKDMAGQVGIDDEVAQEAPQTGDGFVAADSEVENLPFN